MSRRAQHALDIEATRLRAVLHCGHETEHCGTGGIGPLGQIAQRRARNASELSGKLAKLAELGMALGDLPEHQPGVIALEQHRSRSALRL